MTKVQFVDHSRWRAIDVEVYQNGEELVLKFPYNVYLKDEIAGCESARWIPQHKAWGIKDPRLSRRNSFILGRILKNQEDIPGCLDLSSHYYDNSQVVDVNISREECREHQRNVIVDSFSKRCFLLAHEMGAGKTLSLIEIMENVKQYLEGIFDYKQYNDRKLFWVIAPKAPLKAWEYELNKWDCQVKPKLISCDQSVIARHIESANFPPRCLIIDEISRFKNAKAKRTDYLLQLTNLMYREYGTEMFIYGATGTPSPNDISDWWSECEIIQPGIIREKNAAKMRDRYANVTYQQHPDDPTRKYPVVTGWNFDELEKLSSRLSPIVDVKWLKDCFDVPEFIYQPVRIDVTKETLMACRTLVDKEVSVKDALMKLRQFSDGFLYQGRDADGNNLPAKRIKNDKQQAFIDEIVNLRESGETRLVAYAGFTESVDMLTEFCISNGWNVIRCDGRGWVPIAVDSNTFVPEANQAQFLDKNLDIPIAFVGHPDAGGMGLTLVSSKLILVYSNSFKGESRIQMRARIRRPNSRGALIKDFIYLPSDQYIIDKVAVKESMQNLSMGVLMDYIEKERVTNITTREAGV
jgi:hypothetical protein